MAAGKTKDFAATISAGYAVEGPAIDLGRGMHEGELVADAVRVPLRMMNRHGLVAGATGTGKTLQREVLRGVFGMLKKRL
jgi:uncharacterized protein